MSLETWQDVLLEDLDSDLDLAEVEEEIQEDAPKEKIEYTKEQIKQIKALSKDFYSDVKTVAKKYMKQFFSDKTLHCGGQIPKALLFSERRISMVLNYDLIRGIERAYKYLEPTIPQHEIEAAKFSGEATNDIKLVNETLNLLARSKVPQQFAGGILCLYLEFVEGVNIGTEP